MNYRRELYERGKFIGQALLTDELPPRSAEIGFKVEHFGLLNTSNDTTKEAETLLAQLMALNSYLETKQFNYTE